jgi:hypothetical protein
VLAIVVPVVLGRLRASPQEVLEQDSDEEVKR